jgi:hypothetical protein
MPYYARSDPRAGAAGPSTLLHMWRIAADATIADAYAYAVAQHVPRTGPMMRRW